MSRDSESVAGRKRRLLIGIALILLNRVLLKLRLRKPRDGWRTGAGLVLRGDAAKFYLSAFNLNTLSEKVASDGRTIEATQRHIAKRLADFLAEESEFYHLVRHDPEADRVILHPTVSYSLGFEPWTSGTERFIRPEMWTGDFGSDPIDGASPIFQFVCRVRPDRLADLWVRVNHVGCDGVPAQEMLSRLEEAWGVKQPIVFPSNLEFQPLTVTRSSPGRMGTAEVQTFIDFRPLLAWRKRQNQTLTESMTFSAAMLWWLAKHEALSGLHFGTTVELPEAEGAGRGVGVVVVRPANYFEQQDGLARYVTDFNLELVLARERKTENSKTLDAAAFLPSAIERTVLTHALEQGTRAFGSVGLTILKDAKVFGAPLGDAGHHNGFIAIGGAGFETTDGRRVGCVVVKGPEARISSYAQILCDAMNRPEMMH